MEAKTWIRRRVGAPNNVLPREVPKNRVSKPVETSVEDQPDYSVYESFLAGCPLRQSGSDYLASRGISPETISVFQIGQIEDGQELAQQLVRQFGFDRAQKAGLLTKRSEPNSIRLPFPNDGIVFPFIESGRVAYVQVRVLPGLTHHTKWHNPLGRVRRVYNADVLDSDASTIGICEGITDTLSAVELGYAAVGILGVTGRLSDTQMLKLRRCSVAILLDWDQPGNERAKELKAELARFGVGATRKRQPSPNIKDLNQYLIEKRGLA